MPESDSLTMDMNWIIHDAGAALHEADTKCEVLEWAWEHDKDPRHYELMQVPEQRGGA
jgi:hypothetical protein